ncbi:hypothetical protein BH10BDE1_BH10BDE1_26890 [soil metagenome]
MGALLLSIFFSTFALAPAHAARGPSPLPRREMARLHSPKSFVVFDWDDNVFKLPTRLILFAKEENSTHSDSRLFYISPLELSLFKHEVGVAGSPLEKLKLVTDAIDPTHGTFRHTMPGTGGRNYMHEDMTAAVTKDGVPLDQIPDELKSPFFDLFMARESNPETRKANRILTGRGQTKDELYQALSLLATVPEIRNNGFAPPEYERVTLVGGRGNAWMLKAEDLTTRMHEAAAQGYTLFAFQDDDPMNIRKATEVLAALERPIDVWLIWTRGNGDSRLIDLSQLDAARGITVDLLLERALGHGQSAKELASGHSQHEIERSAIMCRALFF